MEKVFLDTNILLDYLADRKPFAKESMAIINKAHKKEIVAFVSTYCMGTVYYLISKFTNHKNALSQIKKIRPLLSIAEMNQQVLDDALYSNFKDFEDALQYYSAIAADCDYFISRNLKDYKATKIPVLSPKSYLKINQQK